MTSPPPCPRFAAISLITPSAYRPKLARDIRPASRPLGACAAARAHRHAAPRERHPVAGERAYCVDDAGTLPPHTRWCLLADAAGANHFRHSVHRCCAMPAASPNQSDDTWAQRLGHDRAALGARLKRRGGSRARRGVGHNKGAAEGRPRSHPPHTTKGRLQLPSAQVVSRLLDGFLRTLEVIVIARTVDRRAHGWKLRGCTEEGMEIPRSAGER